jgi:hypothetical protein
MRVSRARAFSSNYTPLVPIPSRSHPRYGVLSPTEVFPWCEIEIVRMIALMSAKIKAVVFAWKKTEVGAAQHFERLMGCLCVAYCVLLCNQN